MCLGSSAHEMMRAALEDNPTVAEDVIREAVLGEAVLREAVLREAVLKEAVLNDANVTEKDALLKAKVGIDTNKMCHKKLV